MKVLISIILIGIAIFLLDISLPLGMAIGATYIIPILLSSQLQRSTYTIIFAAICSLLTVIGYFYSPLGAAEWIAVGNRTLIVLMILSTTYFIITIKKKQTALSEREAQQRAFLESAAQAIIIVNEKGEILLSNKAAGETFGYSTAELLGKEIEMLIPNEIREKHRKYRDGYNQNPTVRKMGENLDLFGLRKDSSRFPVDISLSYIYAKQGLLITAFITDLSHIKKVQDQLKKANRKLKKSNRKLQRVNFDLEQVAYISSHQLLEPLRMVSSFSQLLLQRCHENLPPDCEEYFQHTMDATDKMARLIRALQMYTSIDTRSEAFAETDLNAVLQLALQKVSDKIERSSAIIHSYKLPTVMAKKDQMEMVFSSLIDNAIKFRSEKPPEISISAVDNEKGWEIMVKDNGISLDKTYQDILFKVFKTLERNAYEGEGIGLAVCKKIVEHHGGRIWYESYPGKGTTFHFTLRKVKELVES